MSEEKYRDYAAKIAEAMGSPDLTEDLVKEHSATRIADYLNSERIRQGLSQRDVAKRMGVSASKICRIEDSYDRDLSYADIESYAKALGVEVEIAFNRFADNDIRQSEGLVYRIDALLGKLRAFVPDAEAFQHAVDDFAGRVLFPVLRKSHGM